jgi:hypothetical protein
VKSTKIKHIIFSGFLYSTDYLLYVDLNLKIDGKISEAYVV